jgi:hypothetical protein
MSQLQQAIALAVASNERFTIEESGTIESVVGSNFLKNRQNMQLNVISRVESLAAEYNKVKADKHELLNRAVQVSSKLDREFKRSLSSTQAVFEISLDMHVPSNIAEFLLHCEMYDSLR